MIPSRISLAAFMFAAAYAWAGSYTVQVLPPNGIDDTVNIQAALDSCMEYGPGCTVQLAGGTYKSQQLIAENFYGTFKGMGISGTTVEVLAPLVVTVSDQNVQDIPPSRTNKYPVLLLFTGGDITVSDLTFKVTDPNPTTPWCYGGAGCGQTWLEAPVGVIGSAANLTVRQIACEGDTGQLDGFSNYNNCVLFWGGAEPLAGTFTFASSRVRHSANSFEIAEVRDAKCVVGGSPADGNLFEDSELGGVILDADHSMIDYSHNQVTLKPYTPYNGLWVLQGVMAMPQEPSQFLIEHNTIKATGGYQDGILIMDYGPRRVSRKTADVVITNNTIQLGGSEESPAYAGVEAYYTEGAIISNNRISGENALLGILVEANIQCMLKGNNLQELQPLGVSVALLGIDSGYRRNTTGCTVVGGNNKVNVYDEGTDNILVGVNNMQSPPGPAIKQAMQIKRDLMRLWR